MRVRLVKSAASPADRVYRADSAASATAPMTIDTLATQLASALLQLTPQQHLGAIDGTLRDIVDRAIAMSQNDPPRSAQVLESENLYLREEIRNLEGRADLVGDSAPLRDALSRVEAVAPTSSTVLLLGETGYRQGAVRPSGPRPQRTAAAPARSRQLRGPASLAHRERAVRTRARSVYGRRGDATRPLRAGRPRHPLPGRNRRPADRPAGEAAARARRRRIRARWVVAYASRRCARDRGHQSGSGVGCGGWHLSRGSVLPAERVPHSSTAASSAS